MGFFPDAFGQGVTVPVIKGHLGDHSSVNNYRPITVGPVVSKLFEYCICHKFEHLFHSDPLQFIRCSIISVCLFMCIYFQMSPVCIIYLSFVHLYISIHLYIGYQVFVPFVCLSVRLSVCLSYVCFAFVVR